MQRLFISALILILSMYARDQSIERPIVVIGIGVGQMRWDYLYRYYDRYATNRGFKRTLNQGITCENTMIPYTPTTTACGHSSIYSGSVAGVTGITGNVWWYKYQMRAVYCTED